MDMDLLFEIIDIIIRFVCRQQLYIFHVSNDMSPSQEIDLILNAKVYSMTRAPLHSKIPLFLGQGGSREPWWRRYSMACRLPQHCRVVHSTSHLIIFGLVWFYEVLPCFNTQCRQKSCVHYSIIQCSTLKQILLQWSNMQYNTMKVQ